MKFLIAITLLLALNLNAQQSPAGIIAIRPAVITKFKNWFLPQFLTKIGKPTFPDVSGGGAKIRNLRVETLTIDVPSTNIQFDNGVFYVLVNNLNICIKGDFEIKKGFIKIKGRITAKSSGAKIRLGYAIGLDAQNKLTLVAKVTEADVNHFDLDISGNVLAQLLDFIKDLFKRDIKNQVNKHLKSALADGVTNGLNKAFQKMKYDAKVFKNQPLSIDFQPSSAPVITADRIEINSNAYFFNDLKAKVRPPFPLPQVPKDLASQDIQLTFDQYFINSLFYSAFDAGVLQETIVSEDVPKDAMVQLTSEGVGSFIPELVEKYGEGKKMNVVIKSTKQPELILTTDKASLEAQLDLSFFVRKTEQDVEKAFTIKTNFVFAVSLRVENNLLKGKIHNAQFTFINLIDPKITPFDPNVLKDMINDALTFVIEGVNEKKLNTGIPINNIKFISLNNAQVVIGNKFFRVLASPEFTGAIPF